MAEQTERSYQKQAPVFQNTKWETQNLGKKVKGSQRYYKNIGLGFKTPREVCYFECFIYSVKPSNDDRAGVLKFAIMCANVADVAVAFTRCSSSVAEKAHSELAILFYCFIFRSCVFH